MKKGSILPLLERFFTEYLPSSKGVSSNTLKAYQYAFRLLFAYFSDEKGIQPDKVTFELLGGGAVDSFLAYLEEQRHCTVKTRNLRRAALMAFAKYAADKDFTESMSFYTAMVKIPKKKEPKNSSIKYFTKEEVCIILSAPNANTLTGQRDITLLSVLYATGARAQELCDITIKDISFSDPTRIKLTGKGNKSRIVTIPQNCTVLLKGYMKSRGFCSNDPGIQNRHLFSSRTNEHMSISCVEGIVRKYLAACRQEHPDKFLEKGYSPHSFRHSIAVHMLEAGDSLVTIKAFLGHASIVTTTIYAQVTPELANKYLDERGKPIPEKNVEASPKPLAQALPFLYK